MGAAEDGRAPIEEPGCILSRYFCPMGAAEDGRAPTEELACVLSRNFFPELLSLVRAANDVYKT